MGKLLIRKKLFNPRFRQRRHLEFLAIDIERDAGLKIRYPGASGWAQFPINS